MQPPNDNLLQAPDKMGITTKFPYTAILFELVKGLTLQSLKLPHESIIANMNEPVGTTEQDIVFSVVRGVRMLHSILNPYFDDVFKTDYAEILGKTPKDGSETVWIVYGSSMEHLAALMRLMHRKRMLLTEDEESIMDEIEGDVVYGDEA